MNCPVDWPYLALPSCFDPIDSCSNSSGFGPTGFLHLCLMPNGDYTFSGTSLIKFAYFINWLVSWCFSFGLGLGLGHGLQYSFIHWLYSFVTAVWARWNYFIYLGYVVLPGGIYCSFTDWMLLNFITVCSSYKTTGSFIGCKLSAMVSDNSLMHVVRCISVRLSHLSKCFEWPASVYLINFDSFQSCTIGMVYRTLLTLLRRSKCYYHWLN